MIVSARPSTGEVGERSEITEIMKALADEIRDQRGGAVHLAEQVAPKNFEATFVGCIDDVAVGFAQVRVVVHDPQNTVGEVLAYGVLPDARGVGVGEAMLDLVIEYCRNRGCTGIDAQALPGARETKNFFETFGFTARRLVVHHSLRNSPSYSNNSGTPHNPDASEPAV
jgi:ribosomal protein S18 acetylase RimI-like enzyme